MKKSILLLFVFFVFRVAAQMPADLSTLPISFVSQKKDTLYLIKDNLGKQIASSWEGEYYQPKRDGRKPYIAFVSQQYILNRHSMLKPKSKALNSQASVQN